MVDADPQTEQARAAAEKRMSSTCTIREPGSSEPVTDPNTGRVTFPEGAVVYSGPCRVRPTNVAGAQAVAVNAGGAEVFRFGYLVSVPFSVAGVKEGYQLTIDSSPDVDLVGRTIEVQGVDRGEHISARRLSCEEVV